MIIAIVSDTHGNVANFKKAINWINNEGIETVFHCGDIGSPESLKESLENFKGQLFGVLGNMDIDFEKELADYNFALNVKINEKNLETQIDSKKVMITHYPESAKELARTGKYDFVFYGHTHKPWEEKIAECKVINPGELAGQIFKPTFAIYDTQTDKLKLKILEKI